MKKILKEFWGYVALFLITCLPLVVGRLTPFAPNNMWYAALHKPFFTPPSWVFGVVWPILYFFMATAAWIIWRHEGDFFARPLKWYYVQLAVNASWMPVFFGCRNLFASMLITAVLWILVALTTQVFFKTQKAAGSLIIPYVVWVAFACVLNTWIWVLN